MIFCVCLPGIVENSVNCHGKVMEFYYKIYVSQSHSMYIYLTVVVNCFSEDVVSTVSLLHWVGDISRMHTITSHQSTVVWGSSPSKCHSI